ncbi:MAG: RNA polymerase factor sigma-54 [Acidobacteria bacterium]|nr:RNA polymerase factor sigma-54 [Acidobacteriota bacterium]MBI3656583.1 RNA polymerase factor sigma-54 [Acidobacteriota bacterium]
MPTDRKQQLRMTPHLALGQRLALTPSLLQKIELLTLSKLELEELINEELVNNPLLEDYTELDQQEAANAANQQTEEKKPEDGVLPERPALELDDSVDLQKFFNNYLDGGFDARVEHEDNDKPSFEMFLAQKSSLSEHLTEQLGLSEATEKIKQISAFLIGNLDEGGYLMMPLEELCESVQCPMEEAEAALQLVQSFDPIGVAARDLRECLLIQLKENGEDGTLAERLIADCLPLMGARKFKEICAKLNCKFEDIKEALDVIRHLTPRPGLKFNIRDTQYVQPEIYIVKVDNEYVIQLNDEGMPMLRLNPTYRAMLKRNTVTGEEKNFLREKFRSAVDLIRSVNQRRQTIYRVCECIVHRQGEFLEKGMQFLKPMLIKDVAEELGVHPSTISRVVTNKYIHTPQGVQELRKFFTSGIDRADGEKLSIVQVKYRLKQIIENENHKNPYADEEIVKILERESLTINRRTIAKYREQMGIAGSRERKVSYLL